LVHCGCGWLGRFNSGAGCSCIIFFWLTLPPLPLRRLRELYGDSNAEALAKRDQALAVLFSRSGWTQEELAKKEGTTQQSVTYRMRFGRFFEFYNHGCKCRNPPEKPHRAPLPILLGTDRQEGQRARPLRSGAATLIWRPGCAATAHADHVDETCCTARPLKN
jgi:hypothetical protein